MKKGYRVAYVFCAINVCSLMLGTSAMAEVYYVICGVSDYKYIDGLAYSDNDAQDFYQIVSDSMGTITARTNAMLLVNRRAGKRTIQFVLTMFSRRIKPGDVLCFFFSGHGTYGEDTSPIDEPDGMDEYICPHDSLPNSPSNDIRDDELFEWLSPTVDKGGSVVVILDTCFSGGAIKSKARIGGKEVEARVKTKQGKPEMKLLDGVSKDLDEPGFVVMTAADEDETAKEWLWFQNGVFTHFLLDSFGGLADDSYLFDGSGNDDGIITTDELWDGLNALQSLIASGHSKDWFQEQTPQIYGYGSNIELIQLEY